MAKKVFNPRTAYYIPSFFKPLSKNYFEWPESKIIIKYWTDDLTVALHNDIKSFGKHGIDQFLTFTIEKLLGTEKYRRLCVKLEIIDEKIYKILPGYALQRFCVSVVDYNKWGIKKFKSRKCDLCRKSFTPGEDERNWFGAFSQIYTYKDIKYCVYCIGDVYGWRSEVREIDKSDEGKKEALKKLANFAKELDQLPPYNFFGNDFVRRYFKQLSRKKRNKILGLLKNMPHPEYYKIRFGSWFDALNKANLLEEGVRRTGRGTQVKAKDGHMCFSLDEKFIDDFLKDNKIRHTKEIFYPKHANLNPNGNFRTDWKVGKYYIEYLGLEGSKQYDKKSALKRELVDELRLKFIEIHREDLDKLETILKPILHKKRLLND